MKRDNVYQQEMQSIPPFEFNSTVAGVFDDMVKRSIPFYQQTNELIIQIVHNYAPQKALIYDLGCSTGTLLELLARQGEYQLIGVDESLPMMERCRDKLAFSTHIELLCSQIENLVFKKADVIIMNYTLQFIPLPERAEILRRIYQALNPGGIFILTEKLEAHDSKINQIQTDLYYDFKRQNGYSNLEISQKREALENVLGPLNCQQHAQMLSEVGFARHELIFKWLNFGCFLGIK